MRSQKKPDGKAMDGTFAEMESRYRTKIVFRKYTWEDEAAEAVISKFTLVNPPASALVDAKGRVVEKFEGPREPEEMSRKLEALLDDNTKVTSDE